MSSLPVCRIAAALLCASGACLGDTEIPLDKAIQIIKEQGEGTSTGIEMPELPGALAAVS